MFSAYSQQAYSDELLDIYVAKISVSDHFNSRGNRLKSVAGIIRQDRANYHKFFIRDDEDDGDEYFSSKSNRAVLERMLNRGYISKSTRRSILNGTPLIFVKIYKNYIEVYVKD